MNPAGRGLAQVGVALGIAGVLVVSTGWLLGRPVPDVGSLAALGARPGGPAATLPAAGLAAARTSDARLRDQPRTAVVAPVSVRIGALGVAARVVGVGVTRTGALDVPPSRRTVAWYRFGATPGGPGSAVLAGHVDFNGRAGVFFELSRLSPGATVVVGFANRTSRTFRVVARREYSKSRLPAQQLFDRSGRPRLVLVTCGGPFDRATRLYRDNVVVYAVPA